MKMEYSYLTVDEIHIALSDLSNLERCKLMKVAHYYRKKYDLDVEAEDILQEVFTRIYEGTRNIPKDMPLLSSLDKIIKSHAHELVTSKSFKSRQQHESLIEDHELVSSPSIEQASIEEQQTILDEQRWKRILEEFSDDKDVLKLIDAICDGYKAREIVQKVFFGNQILYDTTRKRFMRRINKLQAMELNHE